MSNSLVFPSLAAKEHTSSYHWVRGFCKFDQFIIIHSMILTSVLPTRKTPELEYLHLLSVCIVMSNGLPVSEM